MPKSKRHTTIALTAVKKKNKFETKRAHYTKVQEALDDCSHVFVLVPHNMRTAHIRALRERFPGSRFFIGKNTITIRALGTDEASEYKPNLHKLSPHLYGDCMLFVTTEDKQEVLDFFKAHRSVEYARGGFVPIETIERHPGPLDLPHSLEPYLRQLGMPTRLHGGVVHLEGEYQLCLAGKPISHEQARLLQHFEIKLAEFHIEVVAVWSNDGTVEILDDPLEPKAKRQIKPTVAKKTKKNGKGKAAQKDTSGSDESGDDIMEDDSDDSDNDNDDNDDDNNNNNDEGNDDEDGDDEDGDDDEAAAQDEGHSKGTTDDSKGDDNGDEDGEDNGDSEEEDGESGNPNDSENEADD